MAQQGLIEKDLAAYGYHCCDRALWGLRESLSWLDTAAVPGQQVAYNRLS